MSQTLPFDQFTLQVIRYDKSMMNWLEERRYEWIPLAQEAIERVLAGHTILMLCDDEREWFCEYAVTKLNAAKNRPFIPISSLKKIAPYISHFTTNEEIELFFDMLELSYGGRFFIWYVGRSTSSYVRIAKRRDDSFLWIMDEDMQNNFTLQSFDELIDIKLLQLFRLFEKSLEAAIFGEVEFA